MLPVTPLLHCSALSESAGCQSPPTREPFRPPAAPMLAYNITISPFQCTTANLQQLATVLAQALAQLLNQYGLLAATPANIVIQLTSCLPPPQQAVSQAVRTNAVQSAAAGSITPRSVPPAFVTVTFDLVNMPGGQAYSTATAILTSSTAVGNYFRSTTLNAWTSAFGPAIAANVIPLVLSPPPPQVVDQCTCNSHCLDGQYCALDSRSCQPKLLDGSSCRSHSSCVSSKCSNVCNPTCRYKCVPATGSTSIRPPRAPATYQSGPRCSASAPCGQGYSCGPTGRCIPVPGAWVSCDKVLRCSSSLCRWRCPEPYWANACYQTCLQSAASFRRQP